MSAAAPLAGPEAAPASGGDARQLVMFLHGYGADGNDLIGLSGRFASVLPDAAFVSPNAPERCGASPFGHQWYDVWLEDRTERLAAVRRAADALDAFITGELARRGLAEGDLLLVGFSQGTMMSLFVAPRRERPVAGVVGYSGRLEAPDLLAAEIRSRPPVILVHGDADPLLPPAETEKAAVALRACGVVADTHIRPGLGHGIDEEGIRLGVEFSRGALAG